MKSEEKIGEILKKGGLKIAVAESCTGGLVGSKITDVPGASSYFLGGVIAYSNEIKMDILGVKKETLENFGAVSGECAREMAIGVSNLFKADVAIATTGIAGPSGGSKDKPVGLVYIAVKIGKNIEVRKYVFKGKRMEIKDKIANKALEDAVIMLTK